MKAITTLALAISCLSLVSCDTLRRFSKSPEGQAVILEGILEGTATVIARFDQEDREKGQK
jgi:hypothetical protein